MKTSGILTPLIEKMPRKRPSELAIRLNVTRITIWKWQKKIVEISPLNRLKINLLCMEYDVDLIFKDDDTNDLLKGHNNHG